MIISKSAFCTSISKWLVVAVLALVSLAAWDRVCGAAECDDARLVKLTWEYVQQQQKYGFAIVYSECAEPDGKAVLVYPLSNYDPFGVLPGQVVHFDRHKIEWAGIGVLLHFVHGCLTDDISSLRIRPQGVTIADDGGIYEINENGKLARVLSRYPFRFLPPDKVPDFLQSRPTEKCLTPGQE